MLNGQAFMQLGGMSGIFQFDVLQCDFQGPAYALLIPG